MKRVIFTVSALLLGVALLNAQEDASLNRRIEVTRQYVPEVEGARKLDFAPRMTDTVTLKPYIDYSITPTPWKSVFGTEPIEPISISTARYEPALPFYLRVGAGYPLASTANLRAAFGKPSDRYFGIYADHDGHWQQRIDRDILPSDYTRNRLGVKGGVALGRRMLDYDVHYNLNARQWNGFDAQWFNWFNRLAAGIGFGDSFADLTRFNYRVGVEGGLWGNSLQSLTHNGGVGVTADFAWRAGEHGALMLDGRFDSDWAAQGADQLVSLAPHYRLRAGDLLLNAGVKLFYNSYNYNAGGSDFYVIPDVELSYRFLPAVEPYLAIDGSIGSGAYKDLYAMNPYVEPLTTMLRPKKVALQGGLRGNVRDIFVYDLNAGYTVADAFCFVRSLDKGTFAPVAAPLNVTHAAASIGLELTCGFGLMAGARYCSYDNDGNLWRAANASHPRLGMGLPTLRLSGTLSYNWRNRLFAEVTADFAGKRVFASVQDIYTEVPSYVDLSASVEYKFSRRFSIFVQGGNLLDAPVYHYLNYREYGINALAGFSVVF